MKSPRPKLHVIEILSESGRVLEVFDTGSRSIVEKKALAAMRSGAAVRWEDGRVQWFDVRTRIHAGKTGSDVYTWDRSGNKVLADLFELTRHTDGRVTERRLRAIYVLP